MKPDIKQIDKSRFTFRFAQQRPRESFEDFVSRLQNYLNDCEYSDPEALLRDKLISASNELRFRAFDYNMSLTALITMGIFHDTRCTRCGSSEHKYFSNQCQAKDILCKLCFKRGHRAAFCKHQEGLFEPDAKTTSEKPNQELQQTFKQEKTLTIDCDAQERPTSSIENLKRKASTVASTEKGEPSRPVKKPTTSLTVDHDHQSKQESKKSEQANKHNKQIPLYGSVGGLPVKIVVDETKSINVVSRRLFKKLREHKSSIFTMDNLQVKIGQTDFSGQFTSYVEVNQKSNYVSFFIQEGSSDTVRISEKIGQSFGLI